MTTDEAPARRGRAGISVLASAVVSGSAGYVVLLVAARHLDKPSNADFLVFWGALFGVFGMLIGITTETTRSVHSARESSSGGGARLLPVVAVSSAAAVLLLGASGFLWAPALFDERWTALLPALVVGVALFAVHCFLGGVAAGEGAWTSYATLVGFEAVTRLVLVSAAAVLGASVAGLSWAVAAACGTWLVLAAVSARYRAAWRAVGDVDAAGQRRRLLASCTASGASALLLVGFPVLLRVTTPDETFAGTAPLILAVSLSRAPLLVPLGAYQNVVVTRVATHGLSALKGATELLAAATAAGAVLAALAGPAALRLVNPTYHVSGTTFAALMIAAGLVAALTLTGAATIALDHHAVYVGGWLAATAAATALLLVPLDVEGRVLTALLVGPLVGIAVHLSYGARGRRRATAPPLVKGTS